MNPQTQQQQQQEAPIYSFPKSEGEEIQMTIKKYKDRFYIDLRVWYQNDKSPEFKPTQRGVCFTVDRLPDLQKGVDRLARAASKLRTEDKVEV